MILSRTLCLSAVVFCLLAMPAMVSQAADVSTWPQWRGANQDGFGGSGDFPVAWTESEGVAWQTELPGRGGSTPVFAGGKAFLTAWVGVEDTSGEGKESGENRVIAVDIKSGKIDWQTTVAVDAKGKHKKGNGSNPSAVTDGKNVFAYFRSGDLACLSLDGEILWKKNLQDEFGENTLWWDLGTSPLLTDDSVVIAVMQTGPSYLASFDKSTGKQIWKTDRNLQAPKEAAQSYATPLNLKINGRPGIAVMGADFLTLHEGERGKEVGRLGGFNPTNHEYFRSISSPVAADGIVVCPYARGDSITAVRIDSLAAGKGKDAIAWFRDDLGSDVPTPALHDGRVYVVSDKKGRSGLIACLDLETGKDIWTVQLPKSRGSYSSSPLIAGDHLYVTGENAVTYVIGPLSADEPKVVATNRVADSDQFTVASVIPVDGSLLLRTRNKLYRLGK